MATEQPTSTILIGKALYAEFRKDGHTLQLIFTPESMLGEDYVPFHIWRRQISSWNPRRPWRAYSQTWEVLNERKEYRSTNAGKAPTISDKDEAYAYSVAGLLFIDKTFHSLVNEDWKLYKEPIVVEFSQEDLEDTKAWSSPNALVRRIVRSRKALGFEDALFDEPTTPAV